MRIPVDGVKSERWLPYPDMAGSKVPVYSRHHAFEGRGGFIKGDPLTRGG